MGEALQPPPRLPEEARGPRGEREAGTLPQLAEALSQQEYSLGCGFIK